ncbi:MAG: tryptophan synthase subunit alpha [Nitrospirae bacterium]|nr:tryptophan synthase subunit alpha [Nitrospirota bacterium]
MNRIEKRFKKLNTQNRKALIPYIMAGDPDIKTTEELILEIERSGGDLIELGVPFTDPLADGPVIQKAHYRALKNKVTLRNVLDFVKRIREKTTIPLVLMTYYNPIFKYGDEDFIKDAVTSGVDGVIIPDLPFEEAKDFIKTSKMNGLDTIFLLAPTSTPERISMITNASRGFIYYVSITGITGAKIEGIDQIKNSLEKIREVTDKPIAVGFGISTAVEAKKISEWADGIIIGSAIVRVIEENLGSPSIVNKVGEFVKTLSEGIKEVQSSARPASRSEAGEFGV